MIKVLDGIFEKVDYQNSASILLYVNHEYEDYPPHWHTAVEIIMPIDGDYTVGISKNIYHLKKGDILFIPSGELHQLFAPPSGTRYIFQFDFAFLQNLKCFSNVLPILNHQQLITEISAYELHGKLQTLMYEIEREYNSEYPLKDAAIYALIIDMYVLLGRKSMNTEDLFPDVKISKQKEYVEKFNLIFEYINAHFTDDLTLDMIADIAGFSKFHFSRLFKQFTDQSFYDYLNQKRVKQAESLLLNPSLSITDVAMHSGFSSISTFNRVFKQVKNCTPSEFKNFYRKPKGMVQQKNNKSINSNILHL